MTKERFFRTRPVEGSDQGVGRHVITMEEFATWAGEPERYCFGSAVTRKTFVHALGGVHLRSGGRNALVAACMVWLETAVGFDYQTTLRNFRGAGSHRCFTAAEQAVVWDFFRSVSAHAEIPAESFSEADFYAGFLAPFYYACLPDYRLRARRFVEGIDSVKRLKQAVWREKHRSGEVWP